MSNFVKVYSSSGMYGLNYNGIESDADKLVDHITRSVLAQHISDSNRLEATIEAITMELIRFIENQSPKTPQGEQ